MDHTKLNMLSQYIARGWALVPLHDVSAGACSCGQDCRGSAGKHPRFNGWQEIGQLVRSVDLLARLHTASPQWNWGVATGPVSGIFVLDWDVKHDAEIRAWLSDRVSVGAADGNWPPDFGTLTLGPTGSGGWHYVFELPTGFEVRGSQTRNRYGLPPGLDIRGKGGQIVVAPSISGKGPYGGVLLDRPVSQGPPWLLDMIRTAEERTAALNTQAVDRGVDRAVIDLGSMPAGMGDRLGTYARAAVRGSLQELADAPEGTRNDTAARTSRRVLELTQSPWAALDRAAVTAAWFDAGSQCGLAYGELEGVWRRAERDMTGKQAPVPELMALGGEYIPFDLTVSRSGMPPDPFTDPAAPGAVISAPGQADDNVTLSPYELEVSREIWRIKVREEARRRIELEALAGFDERLAKMEAALLTTETLESMPDRVPLVEGLLWRGTFARVIGESGHGKSFVMLDVAAAIAGGTRWAGRTVTRGDVIYLVAEGEDGIKQRVRAWERVNGRPMTGVTFLPMPVQADSPDWDVFTELARRRLPALIVGDTQARLSVGIDENSAKEMGQLVEAMERLRHATGACVTLVHHKGLKGAAGRGSSAVRGALHTEIDVSMDKATRIISVWTPKQKDTADDDAPITFVLRPVVLSEPMVEPVISSAVPVWEEGAGGRVDPADRIISDERLPDAAGRIAAVWAKLAVTPVTAAELCSMVTTRSAETYVCTKATYYRALPVLRENKIIAKILGTQRWRYIPVDARAEIKEEITVTKRTDGYYTS